MENARTNRQKFARQPWKQIIVGLGIFLATGLFSLFLLVEMAEQPFVSAKEKAVAVAKEYVQLKTVEDVQLYNGKETYYSLKGKDNQHQSVFVLVPENASDILVYREDAGISSKEAEAVAKENGATAVERIILGYMDGKPLWEVKSGTAYYLIEFETGQLVKKEGL